MKKFFTTRILLAAVLICYSQTIYSQQPKIDLNALIEETQKTSDQKDSLTLVWWIPSEYWRAALQQETLPSAQVDEAMAILQRYTIIAVVDGKIVENGKTLYRTEQAIRETLRTVDSQNREWAPLSDDQIGPTMTAILVKIKPMVVNMLGSLGSNLHFIVFQGRDAKGLPTTDVRGSGSFTVRLAPGRDFVWRLPLGSLVPKKRCPVDGELLNGNWKYCPWHGAELH